MTGTTGVRGRVGSAYRRYQVMIGEFIWSGGSEAAKVLGSVITFMILGRKLGPEEYGAYVGIYGVIGPIGALTFGGIGLAVMQLHVRDRIALQKTTNSFLGLLALIGPTGVILATAVGSQVISRVGVVAIALLAFAELCAYSLTWLIAAATQASIGATAASRIRGLIPIVRVSGLFGLWLFDAVSVRNFGIVLSISLTMLGLVLVRWWLPRLGVRAGLDAPGRHAVTTSLQLGVATVAVSIQNGTDKTVMNAYGLERDAGLYGAAYRVVSMALIPVRALNAATFHRFLKNDDTERRQHVTRSLRYLLASLPMSLAVAVGVWIAAPLLNVLIGNEFEESVTMIRWLVIYLPIRSLSTAPINGLLGLGRVSARLVALLASSALSMVLYITLIPSLSWKGATVGTIVSELFLASLAWALLVHYQRIHDAELDRAG